MHVSPCVWDPAEFGVDEGCNDVWARVPSATVGAEDRPWAREWVACVEAAGTRKAAVFLPHLRRAVTVLRAVVQGHTGAGHNCYAEVSTGHLEYACECAAALCAPRRAAQARLPWCRGSGGDEL